MINGQKLDKRTLFSVTGEDVADFLNGLVTCETVDMSIGQAGFGALLTPQGKILFDFFVIRTSDGFLFDVDHSLGDDLIKRLTFYRLRRKVDFEPSAKFDTVTALWPVQSDIEHSLAILDPRNPAMGMRLYTKGDAALTFETGDYDAHRIDIGIPEGGRDFSYGDAFPHETLMDQFGGVDFRKGCFVGQEVVSRMQHRGTARKRVVQVSASENLPAPGTAIIAGDVNLGVMGSAVGTRGLAMVRLDRVSSALADGTKVLCDQIEITMKLQDWVGYDWPQTGASIGQE